MYPKRNPNVQTKLLPDGHAVLFSRDNNWAHTITPLAAVAWEYCDGTHSETEISNLVAEIAESAETSSTKDFSSIVKDLLREFKDSGLVQIEVN